MRKLPFLLTIFMLLVTVYPASAGVPNPADEGIKSEAQQGFVEILDLWRDGRFDALHERTIGGGKHTKDSFNTRLTAASRKPACCWEKMQDVAITIISDNKVNLQAKLGFERAGATEFTTRSFKLTKEDGVWKVSRSDILSLVGKAKKAIHHKNKTVRHHKIKTINP